MIFLNNVAKYFQGKALFEQLNLNVHRGDRVGIVGPNGAGKSTLLGMMEGVIEPDKGEVTVEKNVYRRASSADYRSKRWPYP